jgi:dTDP-4-dehydrorhamnose 3,5-epimerase
MKRIETRLEGPLLIEPVAHGDERGFFLETFRATTLAELGIQEDWVQSNHSRSSQGVLRGMHFQPGMAKLVRCARGAILDVVVDIRPGSESFGSWESAQLDDREHRQLYVPDGFAHGFCVLTDEADVLYECSTYYDPSRESGFRFDDPDVGIDWPDGLELLTSARDREAPLLRELRLGA